MNKFYQLLICAILLVQPALSQTTKNNKPFVIPELQEWKGNKGLFTLTPSTSIYFNPASEGSEIVAKQFAEDYNQMFGRNLNVISGKPKKGDFYFTTIKDKTIGEEGYLINISNNVVISANSQKGLYWASRTILQITEQNEQLSLPKGKIKDFPNYELRGFMLDCGRKFFPMSFLRDYVKFMSYYKMNTFQIHLNDNGFKQFFGGKWENTYSAFRMESETFPGLTARDGYYTKKEFIELQKFADSLGIEIIPEIDIPAHSLAFSMYKPEIGSQEYGIDHLDLFKEETYQFVDALLKEYLEGENPVFCGKRVHIGTDEYSNKKKDVVEKFRYFTDRYIRYVESFGKQACVWGALTHAKGDTPVKSENVLMSAWYNGYAEPKEMIKQGYDLVSIPDGYLYIVPIAGYYYNYLNNKFLYEGWTPAQIGKDKFEEKHPQIKGGMFAVWNDHVGNGISTKDVHYRVLPAMQTLSGKMWKGADVKLPFQQFDTLRKMISEGPGLNIAGRVGKNHKWYILLKL
jgi:N-acetyl-beta-hexosaminidase